MDDEKYDLLDRLIIFIHRTIFCRLGKHFYAPRYIENLYNTPYYCKFCSEQGNKKSVEVEE